MAPKTLARVAPPVTALALAESQARNERHQASAVAPNTRKAYASDWKAFEAWCRARGAPALPADPKHVALYLSDMQGAGSKLSSIERALSTISVRHRDALVFFSRTDDAIARTIRGIRRDLGQAAINAKAPLETKILQKLCAGLPETPLGARDRALLTLGFAGAFRRSELVALNVDDLKFTEEGLTVTIRSSKTDQQGVGRAVGIPYASALPVCAVRAVRKWLDVAATVEGLSWALDGRLPVFRALDRTGRGNRLSGHAVAETVKRHVKRAGLDADAYSGHSLRAGFATSAAKAGKTDRAIMRQTGHKSAAMLARYIREVGLFDDNAAAGLL